LAVYSLFLYIAESDTIVTSKAFVIALRIILSSFYALSIAFWWLKPK
jgi:hypothetical protein